MFKANNFTPKILMQFHQLQLIKLRRSLFEKTNNWMYKTSKFSYN